MIGALGRALVKACDDFAAAIALDGGATPLTYRDLADHARSVADALSAAGLKRNEPVHLMVANRPLDMAALIGIWLAGGVAAPVHLSTPASVAAGFQTRTRARFQVSLAMPSDVADPLSIIAPEAPPERPLLGDAALIVFTSGSTGVPKGVVISHDAFLGKIEQIDSLLGFGEGERTLLVLNITFSFGLWVSLLTLLRGGTLVMQPKFDPEAFLDTLVDERITRVGMVPTMMRILFSQAGHEAAIDRVARQASLKQILIGGESLGRSLADAIRHRFAATDLIDIYGLTETSTCDFFAFPADYAQFPGSIGRPSPNVRFRIVDAEGQPLDVAGGAEAGELQIRSPYLMSGYLDDPELTAAAYDDGWFKTGDLARVLQGQVAELMGRQKEVISRAGNKVTPVEIEQAACAHPDVAAAMAVGVDDALLGQRIHLLVVARAGAIDLNVLQAHLQTRLERFKQPDVFYLADALPLGRTGKADRGQFKALIGAGEIAPIRNSS